MLGQPTFGGDESSSVELLNIFRGVSELCGVRQSGCAEAVETWSSCLGTTSRWILLRLGILGDSEAIGQEELLGTKTTELLHKVW
jgi:hypothetical protein